jgi:trans-2-enoyl-CoA reductase
MSLLSLFGVMQSRCSVHGTQCFVVQINPVTAYGFLEIIQVPKGEYLLQQAANSVLGKELISMAQKQGTKTINLVRRHEVVHELKQLG